MLVFCVIDILLLSAITDHCVFRTTCPVFDKQICQSGPVRDVGHAYARCRKRELSQIWGGILRFCNCQTEANKQTAKLQLQLHLETLMGVYNRFPARHNTSARIRLAVPYSAIYTSIAPPAKVGVFILSQTL